MMLKIKKYRNVLKGFEIISFKGNPYNYPEYCVRAIIDVEYKYFWQFKYTVERQESWFCSNYDYEMILTPKGESKLRFNTTTAYQKSSGDLMFNYISEAKDYVEILLIEYGLIDINKKLKVEYTTASNENELLKLTKKMINAKADGDDELEEELYQKILKIESKNFV